MLSTGPNHRSHQCHRAKVPERWAFLYAPPREQSLVGLANPECRNPEASREHSGGSLNRCPLLSIEDSTRCYHLIGANTKAVRNPTNTFRPTIHRGSKQDQPTQR